MFIQAVVWSSLLEYGIRDKNYGVAGCVDSHSIDYHE